MLKIGNQVNKILDIIDNKTLVRYNITVMRNKAKVAR